MMQLQTSPKQRRQAPRHDTLPENVNYQDTGCEVNVSCLTCPLPQCKFDDPAWYQQYRRDNRDHALYAECARGRTVFQVASAFGISPRTVHRALRRMRMPAAISA